MKEFRGRVAAITGAGSGIGRALAEALAARQADLALSDVDYRGLAETAARCRRYGVTVTTSHLDVADRNHVFDWAERVVTDHGRANLLVNNAGVALSANIVDMAFEDFEWLMNINFWGVVHGTQAFLPHLEASGEGHIVNLSSVFGLMAIPTQSAYDSAKFAVRGFTDALRMELEIAESRVSATTVHPGGVKTNIVRNARMSEEFAAEAHEFTDRFERQARSTPADAAAQILQAVERNRRRCLVGPDSKVFDLVSRLPAAIPQRLLAAVQRRQRHR